MWAHSSRHFFKETLAATKISILYARITLTRFTTLYFYIAVITCIVLSALQGVTFTDNANAISDLAVIVRNHHIHGLVVLEGRTLRLCDGIPAQAGTNCTDILTFGSSDLRNRSLQEVPLDSRSAEEDDANVSESSGNIYHTSQMSNNSSVVVLRSATTDSSVTPHANCVLSLRWLDETIHDAQREDVVTFGFQLWLFILALVTILNESIPHLVAAVLGRILVTAWSGYRVQSVKDLRSTYQDYIVPEACANEDLLGNWWNTRINHGTPVFVMNCVSFVALSLLSVKLFQVYTTQSFSRVGASTKIHRMYKIVLLFSVFLQLSGFFSIASTGMWIDKVCLGAMMRLAANSKLYMALFITALVVTIPWFYLGWVCVRKECKIRFGIFVGISVFLLVTSTLMFISVLYRFIFTSWTFFRTMTVTAYVLTVVTTVVAIFCRVNFEKGLAHYLQVADALEGMDFTPVVFSKGDGRDLEKYDIAESQLTSTAMSAPVTVRIPAGAFTTEGKLKQSIRGPSVYSDQGSAVYLSYTPPLVSELSPAPKRLSRAASMRSISTVPAYPRLTTLRSGPGMNELEGGGGTRRSKSAAARTGGVPMMVSVPVRQDASVAEDQWVEARRSGIFGPPLVLSPMLFSPVSPFGTPPKDEVIDISPLASSTTLSPMLFLSVSPFGTAQKTGLPSNPRVGSGPSPPF